MALNAELKMLMALNAKAKNDVGSERRTENVDGFECQN